MRRLEAPDDSVLGLPSNESKMSYRERARASLQIEGLNSWKAG